MIIATAAITSATVQCPCGSKQGHKSSNIALAHKRSNDQNTNSAAIFAADGAISTGVGSI